MQIIENEYYIYAHSIDGVIFYIGASKYYKNRPALWRSYDFGKNERSSEWHDFVRGREVKIDVLYKGLTKEDALKKEIEIISKLKRFCDGGTLVNKSIGGAGGNSGVLGIPKSDETKRKMSLSMTGKKKSEETIKKLCIARLNRGKMKYKGKIVLNTQTGIFYDSVKQAASIAGVNYDTFRSRMEKNYQFVYV